VSRLGRYELIARLAQGGMGEIFLARLEGAAGFEKLYVVKRILPHLADDARFRGMLIAEARIASKLSHANICQVYELGETDGQLYIVMEYLEGITLLPLLRKASKEVKELDYGFIGGVIQQAADALHYAHELRDRDRGNEHLGIDASRRHARRTCSSPSPASSKVLDFGIAKVKDASSSTRRPARSRASTRTWRPSSCAARRSIAAPTCSRSASSTYEMFALRRLFQRKTDYLTFHAVLEQPIADPRRYRPDAPGPLVDVIMKALSRDQAERFPTVRAMGTALADAISPSRPWAHEQIGELVQTLFADEIRQRQAAVAQAIEQNGAAADGPPIASNAAEGDDDEQGFPSVETEAGPISTEVQTVVARLAQRQDPTARRHPRSGRVADVDVDRPRARRAGRWRRRRCVPAAATASGDRRRSSSRRAMPRPARRT
jgi:hypothetical protein